MEPRTNNSVTVKGRGQLMSQENMFGVDVQLSGNDGNAFAIMGACKKAASKANIEKSKVDEFISECMSGDYDHLIRTCMKYFNVK